MIGALDRDRAAGVLACAQRFERVGFEQRIIHGIHAAALARRIHALRVGR
ncbi:MAG: hypothetical protein HND48_16270 [Chloroflexi bacterium]|nr:hypothetical protein [Chloroflexota bacterium]